MFWGRHPVNIVHGKQTERLECGEKITFKGWSSIWTEHHLKNSELERWRSLSDDLADQALAALEGLTSNTSCRSSSPFELIRHHMHITPPSEQDPAVRAFWDEVTRSPPSLLPYEEKAEGPALADALIRERKLVEQGHQVYTKYAGPISIALLYFSLAGGFSSARITRVLELTSYLLPPRHAATGTSPKLPPPPPSVSSAASTSRTFERLCETGQWIIDCMDGYDAIIPPADPLVSIPCGYTSHPGRAWADTIRVRLLHAQMRARVMKAARHQPKAEEGNINIPQGQRYDVEADGIPLNVEDTAATLASFSVAPLWCLQIMGFHLPTSSREAYLALWRHLGFYLGIPVPILRKHFGTWERADAFLVSVSAHLFPIPRTEEERARIPTRSVLQAVAERPVMGTTNAGADPAGLEYHHALARALLRDEFADELGVPRVCWKARIKVRMSFLAMCIPVWFGEVYPRRGWEEKRQDCIRRALPRVVCRSLGARRTKFFAGGAGHARDGATKVASVEEGEQRPRWQDEKWEKVDVESEEWVVEGKEIMRLWRTLWREMAAVVVGVSVVAVGAMAAFLR